MTDRRPRRRPGENRDRLREAGLIEFGLFGYHGASTAGIAERAGVPQPHLYASFRTKQELFLDCLAHAEASLLSPAAAALSTDVLQPRGNASAGALSDWASELCILQAVAASRDPELAAPIRGVLDRLRSALGDRLFNEMLVRGASTLLV